MRYRLLTSEVVKHMYLHPYGSFSSDDYINSKIVSWSRTAVTHIITIAYDDGLTIVELIYIDRARKVQSCTPLVYEEYVKKI